MSWSGWACRPQHTHSRTPSGGFTKDEIFASASSVAFPTASTPSPMRYYVSFLLFDVCDVLLGQPYLWKRHAMYESRPRVVAVTLGNKLYRIPEVPLPSLSLSLLQNNAVR